MAPNIADSHQDMTASVGATSPYWMIIGIVAKGKQYHFSKACRLIWHSLCHRFTTVWSRREQKTFTTTNNCTMWVKPLAKAACVTAADNVVLPTLTWTEDVSEQFVEACTHFAFKGLFIQDEVAAYVWSLNCSSIDAGPCSLLTGSLRSAGADECSSCHCNLYWQRNVRLTQYVSDSTNSSTPLNESKLPALTVYLRSMTNEGLFSFSKLCFDLL